MALTVFHQENEKPWLLITENSIFLRLFSMLGQTVTGALTLSASLSLDFSKTFRVVGSAKSSLRSSSSCSSYSNFERCRHFSLSELSLHTSICGKSTPTPNPNPIFDEMNTLLSHFTEKLTSCCFLTVIDIEVTSSSEMNILFGHWDCNQAFYKKSTSCCFSV